MNKNKNENKVKTVFETKKTYCFLMIINFFLTILIAYFGIIAAFVGLPFYLAIPFSIWFSYTAITSVFKYKFHWNIFKVEFDDEKEEVIFYYRMWGLFGVKKYMLPYSALKLIFRQDLRKAVFIKDMRKGRRGIFIGSIPRYNFFGRKDWYKDLWDNMVAKLEQIAKEKGHGTSFAIVPK